MFARCLLIGFMLAVVCLGRSAYAQKPDPALGSGWPNGTWSTNVGSRSGDRTTFRDASGRLLGSAVQQGSRTTFRDSSGRSVGSADSSSNRTTFRDASGRSVQSATNSQNRTAERSLDTNDTWDRAG